MKLTEKRKSIKKALVNYFRYSVPFYLDTDHVKEISGIVDDIIDIVKEELKRRHRSTYVAGEIDDKIRRKRSYEIARTRKICIVKSCVGFAVIGSCFCDYHERKIKCQK